MHINTLSITMQSTEVLIQGLNSVRVTIKKENLVNGAASQAARRMKKWLYNSHISHKKFKMQANLKVHSLARFLFLKST